MLEYILDTNIVIYAIRNRPEGVRDAFKRHRDIEGRKACHPLDCRIALDAVASELASRDDLEAIAALFAVGALFRPSAAPSQAGFVVIDFPHGRQRYRQ